MSDTQQDAVFHVVQEMVTAYSVRDMDEALSYFPDNPDLVCIGTGPREKSLGKDELKATMQREFDDARSMAVNFPWHRVVVRGDVAWVAAECLFTLEADFGLMNIKARLTAVLELLDGKWSIMQTHMSLPYPREED